MSEMRRVIYSDRVWSDGGYRFEERGEAWFHMFYVWNCGSDETQTMALVELDDGTVRELTSECIRFLTGPEIPARGDDLAAP